MQNTIDLTVYLHHYLGIHLKLEISGYAHNMDIDRIYKDFFTNKEEKGVLCIILRYYKCFRNIYAKYSSINSSIFIVPYSTLRSNNTNKDSRDLESCS